MTGPFLEVEITGDQEVNALLESIVARGEDLSPVFRGPIDASVTNMIRKQFETSGSFGGTPWAPIRESTVENRLQNRGGINHPLWDTGELKASMEGGGDSFRDITAQTYSRGSTLDRATLHQVGYTISQWGGHQFQAPVQVPARPMIPDEMPNVVLEEWASALEAFLEALD